MSNKSKKNSKKNNKVAWLVVVIILGLCGVAAGIMATVSGLKKSKADKTVRVAFYGLSEEYVKILQEKIPVEEKII